MPHPKAKHAERPAPHAHDSSPTGGAARGRSGERGGGRAALQPTRPPGRFPSSEATAEDSRRLDRERARPEAESRATRARRRSTAHAAVEGAGGPATWTARRERRAEQWVNPPGPLRRAAKPARSFAPGGGLETIERAPGQVALWNDHKRARPTVPSLRRGGGRALTDRPPRVEVIGISVTRRRMALAWRAGVGTPGDPPPGLAAALARPHEGIRATKRKTTGE
jgi:hypothetical protein